MTLPDLSRSQLEEIIHEWIVGQNAERDRAILARKLLDGITFEKLAEEFNLSVRRTKTIVYKGQCKVFKHIPV